MIDEIPEEDYMQLVQQTQEALRLAESISGILEGKNYRVAIITMGILMHMMSEDDRNRINEIAEEKTEDLLEVQGIH